MIDKNNLRLFVIQEVLANFYKKAYEIERIQIMTTFDNKSIEVSNRDFETLVTISDNNTINISFQKMHRLNTFIENLFKETIKKEIRQNLETFGVALEIIELAEDEKENRENE